MSNKAESVPAWGDSEMQAKVTFFCGSKIGLLGDESSEHHAAQVVGHQKTCLIAVGLLCRCHAFAFLPAIRGQLFP